MHEHTTNKYSLSWRKLPIHNHSSFVATEASVSLVITAFWANLTTSIMHKNGTRVILLQTGDAEPMLWRCTGAILCLHVLQFHCSMHLPVKSESQVNSGEDTGTVLWGGTDVCTSSWRSYRDGVMRRYGCLYLFMEKIHGLCYEEACTSSWKIYMDCVTRRYGCLYLFTEKIQGLCYEEV